MTKPGESVGVGLRWVLLATAVAGVLGYLIQAVAPALLSDGAAYVAFSVTWSAVYLCGSAMAGVQQEVSRATRPATGTAAPTGLARFAWIGSAAVALLGVILGVALTGSMDGASAVGLGTALAVALTGYFVTTVLTGVLYGMSLWRHVALLVIMDAVLRAVALFLVFWSGGGITVIALAIALPFAVSALAVWSIIRGRIAGRLELDVTVRGLVGNVARTIGAAACMGVMISGLPLLIGITRGSADDGTVGASILAITLTRAPIVVPVIALQSFLIAAVFRGRPRPEKARLATLVGIAAIAAAVLSTAGYFVGPAVVTLISAGDFTIAPWLMATIIASGVFVAVMCVSSAALIAANQHTANLVGWCVAAVLTLVGLLLPAPFELRLAVALAVPPLVGVAFHLRSLLAPREAAAAL